MPDLPPPLPTLPGTRWRPLTPGDVAAWVRLQEAARIADGGEEVATEETSRRELDDPHAPPATNSLVLEEADGALAGWITVHERLEGTAARRVFLWGVTHPARRGLGIGSALLRWGIARGEELLGGQPADLPRLLETFREERLAEAIALHAAAGFVPARWYFDMRRDLREPIPAEEAVGGVRIEEYATAAAALSDLGERVRLAHNEAFADHWGSEPQKADTWAHDFVGHPYFRGDLSFVAFDRDTIAGYSVNYVSEADWSAAGIREGWVGQLGVRRPWRRQGLATALLVRSMRGFRDAGLEAATLGVDAENPTGALGVYERVGFVPIRRSVRLQRPYRG